MQMNNYQQQAMVFRKPTADALYAVMGLAEEAGEVVGKYSKWRRDGMDKDDMKAAVVKELGDVMWMVAAIASDWEVPLDLVAAANIAKLNGRLSKGTISGSGDDR